MKSPVGVQPACGLIVNVSEFEAAAPGLTTFTVAVPDAAIRLAGTVAPICVPLTTVLLSDTEFHRTDAPVTKLLPNTLSANPGPPAAAVAGARVPIVAAVAGGVVVVA